MLWAKLLGLMGAMLLGFWILHDNTAAGYTLWIFGGIATGRLLRKLEGKAA